MQAESLYDVDAPVSYITPTKRKPFAYEYDPPPGTPRRSASYRDHLVRIRSARGLNPTHLRWTSRVSRCGSIRLA